MNAMKSTRAAQLLGIPYSRLTSLLRAAKLPAPQKDSSGDYWWSPGDLDAARRALTLDRRRKGVMAATDTGEPSDQTVALAASEQEA